MKKILYIVLLLSLFIAGCKEDEKLIYHDKARVELVSEDKKAPADYSYSFVWGSDTRVRDTVFIPIRVIGGSSNIDRHIMLEQISEYKVTYTYDNIGKVKDSTVVERTDKAVAGKHYIAFNDESIKPLLTVKAGRVKDSIGIVVLRDASLNWNYTTKAYLGNYSTPKHKLMLLVVGNKVDDMWVAQVNKSKSFAIYWRGKFIEALELFNNNPANITSGLAPMREDPSNPNSPLVTFPTGI